MSLTEQNLNKISTNKSLIAEKLKSSTVNRKKFKRLSSEVGVIRSLVLIIIMFCLAWAPYAIMSLILQYSKNRTKYVTPNTVLIPVICAKSSATINPILYALTNKELLTKLKRRFKFARHEPDKAKAHIRPLIERPQFIKRKGSGSLKQLVLCQFQKAKTGYD